MTNQYPWDSNTTPPIASQDDPRYETPGGATNKIEQSLQDSKEYTDARLSLPELPIQNGAIVERHIRDENISTRTIAQKSVTLPKIGDDVLSASNHTYSGQVSANTVKGALDTLDSRVQYFIDNSGTSIAELIDARVPTTGSPFPNLRARLNDSDTKLGQTARLSVGKKGIMYAATIRNDGTGWSYIEDAVHHNINFSSISTDDVNKNIVVNYSERAKIIGSLVVTPDETLAASGLTCGASVGDTVALIRCSAPFTGYIDGTGAVTCSPWFAGTTVATPLADNTGFSITYDGGGGSSLDAVLATMVRDNAAPYYGTEVRTARGSTTVANMRSFNDLYANIFYDGTSWQASTACVANFSFSFDNVTGILTITHDSMASQTLYNNFQNPVVTMRDSITGTLIHARVVQVTQSTVRVIFRDSTGAAILTPNTNMRMYLSRPGFKVPHVWANGMRVYFNFGYTLIRPSKLVSGNGNLWILGLHEAN
ncbi:hypothetical protein [Paenibacillus odorifer]|uniref:hypothetical protein n=1 Tax=Paenibacillus odorifer TaxID=189426 RepID=UPI00096D11B8|nr:hypothetical protein [Paenibacillus odorifer]OMD92714.1 hypothetical protein BSK67_18295 [Paenibacillus odorifer]